MASWLASGSPGTFPYSGHSLLSGLTAPFPSELFPVILVLELGFQLLLQSPLHAKMMFLCHTFSTLTQLPSPHDAIFPKIAGLHAASSLRHQFSRDLCRVVLLLLDQLSLCPGHVGCASRVVVTPVTRRLGRSRGGHASHAMVTSVVPVTRCSRWSRDGHSGHVVVALVT